MGHSTGNKRINDMLDELRCDVAELRSHAMQFTGFAVLALLLPLVQGFLPWLFGVVPSLADVTFNHFILAGQLSLAACCVAGAGTYWFRWWKWRQRYLSLFERQV